MRFKIGTARYQQSFLSLDDHISSGNPVRLIDQICNEFIDNHLEVIRKMISEVSEQNREDTKNKGTKGTGRKAYHPGDLLKLFVYGYFNAVSSSRKLETECVRNLEVQWLLSGLVPDHKTVSDFRKDNPDLIRGLFEFLVKRFVEMKIIVGKKTAVDGSKVKAYASKEVRHKGLQKKLTKIEEQLEKYMTDMARIDGLDDDCEEAEKKREQLIEDIENLKSEKKDLEGSVEGLKAENIERKCLTDPESKRMKSRQGMHYGFNLQIAVDTECHMITDYLLTNQQNDKGLLSAMVAGSEQITGQKPEEVLADGGYYKATEIEELEKGGTECFVAVNETGSKLKDGENGLEFTYNKEKDHYVCSGGRILEYKRKKTEKGFEKRIYKSKDCSGCQFLDLCTKPNSKDRNRTYTRNHNQVYIDAYKEKMKSDEGKEKMVKRKSTVEHPFGTMKYCMGQIPVLLRGRKKVSSEMGLYVIAYNLKRFITIKAENPTISWQDSWILDSKSEDLCSKFMNLFYN